MAEPEPNEEQRREKPSGTGEDMHPGTDAAKGTAPIAEDAVPGQTQAPAPGDDVGVPEDVESDKT
jgi:hypothetical protein